MRLTDFFIAYQRYRRIIKYIFLQKKKTEKYNRNQEIWIHVIKNIKKTPSFTSIVFNNLIKIVTCMWKFHEYLNTYI